MKLIIDFVSRLISRCSYLVYLIIILTEEIIFRVTLNKHREKKSRNHESQLIWQTKSIWLLSTSQHPYLIYLITIPTLNKHAEKKLKKPSWITISMKNEKSIWLLLISRCPYLVYLITILTEIIFRVTLRAPRNEKYSRWHDEGHITFYDNHLS